MRIELIVVDLIDAALRSTMNRCRSVAEIQAANEELLIGMTFDGLLLDGSLIKQRSISM